MIAQFALRLICGMSLMWALMPRRQVTSGFFRIQMLVVMGLGVLAALTAERGRHEITTPVLSMTLAFALSVVIALAGFLGSVLWTLERRTDGERVGFLLLTMSSGMILAMNLAHESHQDVKWYWTWLAPLSDYSGAAILGGAVVGMLLGHWYLTAPTMSIEPLKRINLFLGISGATRLVLSTVAIVCLFSERLQAAKEGSRLSEFVSLPPVAWLGLRWFAGVIGPLIVSLMVWRILKYRNTQAATGVLFVGVILAFIGDMTAALLLRETGLPL